MHTKHCKLRPGYYILASALALNASALFGQQASNSDSNNSGSNEEVVVLSPFEVSATDNQSYTAATTLAGNRLNTEVRDIGNAVTVITKQFLTDIGATDNQTLLQYTTNTEVGGFYGNFAGFGDSAHLDESGRFTNPNQNTRVRGLTSADNTREYFLTSIPWEGYNIDGVDLQRGPNSILFGQGSPAGIINTRIKQASYKDSYEASFRVGSWGSTRATIDINKVLIKNELAIRISAVRNDQEYKQDPAYSLDKRLYAAVRWEPGFLKKGSARTIVKANVEWGDVGSNNPRELPPTDAITPWFYTGTYSGYNVANQPFTFPNLNKMTINSEQNQDDNTGIPGHGLNRPSHNGPSGTYIDPTTGQNELIPTYLNNPQTGANYASGTFTGQPNEYFQPWIAGSMLGVFGSPAFNFQYNDATQGTAVDWEPQGYHGMNSSGVNGVRTNSVTAYIRPGSVATYSNYATNARLYYKNLPAWQYGLFKDKSLTDASVFDFYNQLLDGPTKHEFQNFRAINLSLDQTFFHDQVGFELTYYKEFYKSGRNSLIADSLNLDFNKVYSDGSPYGKNGVPYEDGTPNPNLGKAYVGGAGNGNVGVSNREDGRLTVFVDHDFAQDGHNWFTRALGRHVITGLLSGDRQETSNHDYDLYSIDDPAYEKAQNGSANDNPLTPWTGLRPFTFIYLGDSLLNASSASGAHIPNPKVNPMIASGQVINFDATWKPSTNPNDPSYVNPGAYWHNPYDSVANPIAADGQYRDANGNVVTSTSVGGTGIPYDSTQSENPQNYVGFRPYNINIINSLTSQANMDRNTTGAQLNKNKVFSRAFNWQGHFWDNALVVTWGVRKDIASAWAASIDTNSSGVASDYFRMNSALNSFALPDAANNRLEVTSHAWTTVLHLNQLPYLNKLPIQVSLFYNKSTDFQPSAQRVDVYGVPLSAPSGKTVDKGILLESADGKYSLKINKYETASVNASSAGLNGGWFIGASQVWAGNWVNRFQYNWTGDSIANAADPSASDYETNTIDNYGQAPGETAADAKARENSVISAWRAWQASVDPRFYQAWGIDLTKKTGLSYHVPNGFSVPEDSTSEGYEIEVSAQPTRNWRLTLNASKTEAQRENIGGANLTDFISKYETALNGGAKGGVGDLRIWWGGAGNETTLQEWNTNIGSEYHQRKLQEGTDVPELRKWRWNAISNYTFDHGPLKNFNVGGSVRYQSSIVIGYQPIAGATANTISFDIADPYRGPSETDFGLWVGYSRKIWHNINWNIQLNIQNIGVGNELEPVTTEPDGTPATFRIRAPQSWLLTNTFYF
ncbi:MAG TPA: TonB-dependent receptor plug domain-containing protein [Opitutus sp.]|nr:TonB-dependent receptor plug domain-containing protein [Opitutus sp.]